MQNSLFAAFEELLNARIEAAIAAGLHDSALETIRDESLTVPDRRTDRKHASREENRQSAMHRNDRNRHMFVHDGLHIRHGKQVTNTRPHAHAGPQTATNRN